MKRLLIGLAVFAACSTPAPAVVFEEDPAIGAFALDPSSPVIARGPAGSLDELGATAPSVYSDALGRHAVYLGIDSDGGTHLLGADEIPAVTDAGPTWQKQATPVVDTSTPVYRPAAIELSGQLQVFYDQPDSSNNPQIVKNLLAPGYSMASVIANEFSEASDDMYRSALIEIGLALFIVTIIVNALARILVWAVTRGAPARAA